MVSFQYTIQDDLGIHARPAGVLCREVKQFESVVSIISGEKRASMNQIFALMSLGIKKGDTITVEAEGSDEVAAAKAMQKLLQEQL